MANHVILKCLTAQLIFRSTVVKPYYSENLENCEQELDLNKETNPQIRRYPVRQRVSTQKLRESQYFQNMDKTSIFITAKEKCDIEISKQLRSQGIIKIPGLPFELSRKQEIDGLIARGVFELIPWKNDFKNKIRFYNSRFVDEIKGKDTAIPNEISRLVIQTYCDDGKLEILTQSPTIQRASQRLILVIIPS